MSMDLIDNEKISAKSDKILYLRDIPEKDVASTEDTDENTPPAVAPCGCRMERRKPEPRIELCSSSELSSSLYEQILGKTACNCGRKFNTKTKSVEKTEASTEMYGMPDCLQEHNVSQMDDSGYERSPSSGFSRNDSKTRVIELRTDSTRTNQSNNSREKSPTRLSRNESRTNTESCSTVRPDSTRSSFHHEKSPNPNASNQKIDTNSTESARIGFYNERSPQHNSGNLGNGAGYSRSEDSSCSKTRISVDTGNGVMKPDSAGTVAPSNRRSSSSNSHYYHNISSSNHADSNDAVMKPESAGTVAPSNGRSSSSNSHYYHNISSSNHADSNDAVMKPESAGTVAPSNGRSSSSNSHYYHNISSSNHTSDNSRNNRIVTASNTTNTVHTQTSDVVTMEVGLGQSSGYTTSISVGSSSTTDNTNNRMNNNNYNNNNNMNNKSWSVPKGCSCPCCSNATSYEDGSYKGIPRENITSKNNVYQNIMDDTVSTVESSTTCDELCRCHSTAQTVVQCGKDSNNNCCPYCGAYCRWRSCSTSSSDTEEADNDQAANYFDLPYQNNHEYMELLQELEDKLVARNRERVRRTMQEFEMRSRQNVNLDKPIFNYDSGDDGNSVVTRIRPKKQHNHSKNNNNITGGSGGVKKQSCCCGTATSRVCDGDSRKNSDIFQNERRWDCGRMNFVETVVRTMDPNLKQQTQKYPKFQRSMQGSRWQMDPRTGEWVKVSFQQADYTTGMPFENNNGFKMYGPPPPPLPRRRNGECCRQMRRI